LPFRVNGKQNLLHDTLDIDRHAAPEARTPRSAP
jgi:hypothetical protein